MSAVTARRLGRRGAPSVLPARPPGEPGVLHLGLGNFHRAHQAVYTAQALEAEDGPWGVVGAASTSREVVERLREQDRLYTVLTLTPGHAEPLVVGVHTDLLVAAEQPEALTRWFADERIRVVTITVTERGYTYAAATGGLDLALPQVRADLAGQRAPGTTIGQLARGLQSRYRAHAGPLTVVSCDNLTHNGRHTRALVLEFVEHLRDVDAGALRDWIATLVTFPSTMVDRIVPVTDDTHRDLAADLLGVRDGVPVPAEPFSMWVLEEAFAAGRPRWEAGGAVFTGDVEPYELLKLRLLNGTHSLIAYLGLLAGARTIADAIVMPQVRRAAEAYLREEMLPSLSVPPDIDVEAYISQLWGRFANTATGHLASQVGSDGSLKLPVRITDPALASLAGGRTPRGVALLLAAYIRCLTSPDAYDPAAQGPIRDPRSEQLRELACRHPGSRPLVEAVLRDTGIFAPSLGEQQPLLDAVADLHQTLTRSGPGAAVDSACT